MDKHLLNIGDVAHPVRRRQYMVPAVVLKPLAERTLGKNGWFDKHDIVPVLGPAHGDPEISYSAAEQHYHVDWRFVDPSLRREIRDWKGDDYEKGIVVWACDVLRLEAAAFAYRVPAVDFTSFAGITLRAALEPLHVDAVLPANRRCPHRGADLTHCKPDANGIVTCPMHGLRWHSDTGLLAPTIAAAAPSLPIDKNTPTS